MSEYVLRIEKLENGYEVEICDAKVVAANDAPKSKGYSDPWKGYAFKTAAEVAAFVASHLDSLKPPPDADKEFGDAFKEATTEED
jgi:hypothetical protein